MKQLIGSTLAVVVLLAGGCGSGDNGAGAADRPNVPAPVSTAPAPASAKSLMPDDLLALPGEPPADPDVRRLRENGADLPPQIDPCRESPPGQAGRVAGRQIIVVSKTGTWKSERLTIYTNLAAAARAMNEVRGALSRCHDNANPDGTTTRWQSEPLSIGEEAFFVGGQMSRGQTVIRGHFHGVFMRQGRAVMIAFDFGRSLDSPKADETKEQQKHVRDLAARLRGAAWLAH